MADDIYRLTALDPRVSEGSRPNRRSDAAGEIKRMIDQEMVIGGGADELTAYLRQARERLGFDTFIASVYPAGVEQERVRRTMRLLATKVAPEIAPVAAGS
jgi:hypothetical protein